jgi:hypothetical protein
VKLPRPSSSAPTWETAQLHGQKHSSAPWRLPWGHKTHTCRKPSLNLSCKCPCDGAVLFAGRQAAAFTHSFFHTVGEPQRQPKYTTRHTCRKPSMTTCPASVAGKVLSCHVHLPHLSTPGCVTQQQ